MGSFDGHAWSPTETMHVPAGDHSDVCPVSAVREWIDQAHLSQGPLFRSVLQGGRVHDGRLNPRSITLIVKRAVVAAGYDPVPFAAHSLCSGSAITQALDRSSIFQVRRRLGYRSLGATLWYFFIADSMGHGDADDAVTGEEPAP